MNEQSLKLQNSAIKSQHQTIIEGGKLEEFAEALGRFCQVKGWKQLKDENGKPFKSLRHYIEASPPFGAGYPGKEGMEKIEAYLSLKPKIKDFFQHCHANCIYELSIEEGINPIAISKREWNDTKGAKLAREISLDAESVYMQKARAYLEGKERVVRSPKQSDPNSSQRISLKPNYPYAIAKKLIEILSDSAIDLLRDALKEVNIDQMVEFERDFHIGLSVFNKTKESSGWGVSEIKAPIEFLNRVPKIEFSNYIDDEDDTNLLLELSDKNGLIAVLRTKGVGGGIAAISFNKN